MNLEDAKIGTRVVYARGSNGPLIGKSGTIVSEGYSREGQYRLIMVKFDDGNTYHCLYKNLDRIQND
jgi:ribosomal protein S4E